MDINTYVMRFDGQVLKRGFWLYVLEILYHHQKYIYVGRTGDSSSPNASSPFNRIGQHLDFRENARGNSLAKRLKEAGVEPEKSRFRMLALGPFYSEQESFDAHRPYRDQMATLEYEIAEYLRVVGGNVLGSHHIGTHVHPDIVNEIKSKVMEFLDDVDS